MRTAATTSWWKVTFGSWKWLHRFIRLQTAEMTTAVSVTVGIARLIVSSPGTPVPVTLFFFLFLVAVLRDECAKEENIREKRTATEFGEQSKRWTAADSLSCIPNGHWRKVEDQEADVCTWQNAPGPPGLAVTVTGSEAGQEACLACGGTGGGVGPPFQPCTPLPTPSFWEVVLPHPLKRSGTGGGVSVVIGGVEARPKEARLKNRNLLVLRPFCPRHSRTRAARCLPSRWY